VGRRWCVISQLRVFVKGGKSIGRALGLEQYCLGAVDGREDVGAAAMAGVGESRDGMVGGFSVRGGWGEEFVLARGWGRGVFVFGGFHEAGGETDVLRCWLLWGKLPFVRGEVNREEVRRDPHGENAKGA